MLIFILLSIYRAVQWVKSTGNAKLLEALCEHGLQIGDSAREAIVAMERDTSTTAGMGVASRAIERGSKLFHDKVKVLTAAVGDAQLPRVLAYIVAEYAVCMVSCDSSYPITNNVCHAALVIIDVFHPVSGAVS